MPNPAHRFPLACGADPDTLGLRVPKLDTAAHRRSAGRCCRRAPTTPAGPIRAGCRTCRVGLRDAAELVLDGGELPGTPSTVIDLRDYAKTGEYAIVRQGLFPADEVASRLR